MRIRSGRFANHPCRIRAIFSCHDPTNRGTLNAPAWNREEDCTSQKWISDANSGRHREGRIGRSKGDHVIQEISKYLLRYADAKCHLWNAYFVDRMGSLSECEPLDSFEAIDRRLFFSLVCDPLGIEYDHSWGADCINQIVVRSTTSSTIPLLISRKKDGNTSWEEENGFPIAGLSFAFVEFFQWDRYGYLYLPKVRCKIVAFEARPECIGREALLDRQHVEFVLAEKGTE